MEDVDPGKQVADVKDIHVHEANVRALQLRRAKAEGVSSQDGRIHEEQKVVKLGRKMGVMSEHIVLVYCWYCVPLLYYI